VTARQRGEHTTHLRWRPQRPLARDDAPASEAPADETTDDGGAQWAESIVADVDELEPLAEPSSRPRRWPAFAVILAVALAAAALNNSTPTARAPATSTPTGWIDRYMAWSVRSPQRVCKELLTPTLSTLFAKGNGGSCVRAYAHVRNTPFRVLRILEDGETAAVELRWLPNGGYSTIVLNRAGSTWRAVDMVPGGHVLAHPSGRV
jgi:hypothetical protein